MNDTEQLILISRDLGPRDKLFTDVEGLPPHAADIVALALRLKQEPGTALRALVEEWDRFRITRELY